MFCFMQKIFKTKPFSNNVLRFKYHLISVRDLPKPGVNLQGSMHVLGMIINFSYNMRKDSLTLIFSKY